MKRRTEKTFRNILRCVDQNLDELAAQDGFQGLEPAPDLDSTPIRRVRAKLDELALAIEFELQIDKAKAKGSPSDLSNAPLESSVAQHGVTRTNFDSKQMPASEIRELSPFEKSVDQWFKDHALGEDEDE